MKRFLITGGDGTLGRSIVKTLSDQGNTVRVMSRKAKPESLDHDIEWAQADIVTGDGVEAALDGVHTIVNCMSSPLANTYETDIVGLQRFLAQAKQQNVQYVVHISIIGIDRIMFPYYQYKLGSELVVIESGIPYVISRIAQFHTFVDWLLSPLRDVTGDSVAIPGAAQVQPISPDDVAIHLAPTIVDGAFTGRLPDFGGPEVLRLETLADTWLRAQGINKAIIPATETENDLPMFNYFGDGFINGYNTNPDNCVPGQSWEEYLLETYGVTEK